MNLTGWRAVSSAKDSEAHFTALYAVQKVYHTAMTLLLCSLITDAVAQHEMLGCLQLKKHDSPGWQGLGSKC